MPMINPNIVKIWIAYDSSVCHHKLRYVWFLESINTIKYSGLVCKQRYGNEWTMAKHFFLELSDINVKKMLEKLNIVILMEIITSLKISCTREFVNILLNRVIEEELQYPYRIKYIGCTNVVHHDNKCHLVSFVQGFILITCLRSIF